MSLHPQEPPDDGGEEEEAKKNKYKRTLSRQAVEARARAGALLGENYEQLRATCPKLPQTGYLSRAKILEGQCQRSGRYREKFGTCMEG